MPHDVPDYHEPDLESLFGTQEFLGRELCRALGLVQGYDQIIQSWEEVFRTAPRTLVGSEQLWPQLDLLHMRVVALLSNTLDEDQRAVIEDVLDSWEQVSQDNDQTPFGEFSSSGEEEEEEE